MKKHIPEGNIVMEIAREGGGRTIIRDAYILPPEEQKRNLARIAEMYVNALLRQAAAKESQAAV